MLLSNPSQCLMFYPGSECCWVPGHSSSKACRKSGLILEPFCSEPNSSCSPCSSCSAPASEHPVGSAALVLILSKEASTTFSASCNNLVLASKKLVVHFGELLSGALTPFFVPSLFVVVDGEQGPDVSLQRVVHYCHLCQFCGHQ